MIQRKTLTTEKLASLKVNKIDTDQDAEYSKGFEKTCLEQNVDPLQVLEIANTLELRL